MSAAASAHEVFSYAFSRDAPDTDMAGYPAILRAGYPVEAGYRISGWIFN
jgi:hypothetical protein